MAWNPSLAGQGEISGWSTRHFRWPRFYSGAYWLASMPLWQVELHTFWLARAQFWLATMPGWLASTPFWLARTQFWLATCLERCSICLVNKMHTVRWWRIMCYGKTNTRQTIKTKHLRQTADRKPKCSDATLLVPKILCICMHRTTLVYIYIYIYISK